MTIDTIFEKKRPRSYVVLDLESAVIDESGHRRYQAMERWVPGDHMPSRRGYTRNEDPCVTPRWPFQTIVTAAAMVLTEHDDGNLDIARFVTLSAPDHDERAVIAGVLQVLEEAPEGADLVSWGGMLHDAPLLVLGAMRHGLTLPRGWGWLAFGGHAPRQVDLARVFTANFKMKPVHMAEVLAALDLPGKITVPAFSVARLACAGEMEAVQEACEVDAVSTALLLARWRCLHDGRAEADAVTERLLRHVVQLRAGRGYVAELEAHRRRLFARNIARAANDAATLAPWLLDDAA